MAGQKAMKDGTSVTVFSKEGELFRTEEVQHLWPRLFFIAALFLALEMLLCTFWRQKVVKRGDNND